jgi:DNA polymerase III gamma/tau subunit
MFNKKHTLFTEKYRPDTLEGYIGNDDFKSSLQQWIDSNDIPHLLLCGGAGTGKTTSAKHYAFIRNLPFYSFSSSVGAEVGGEG